MQEKKGRKADFVSLKQVSRQWMLLIRVLNCALLETPFLIFQKLHGFILLLTDAS